MPSHRDTARQFPWDRLPTSGGIANDLNFASGAANWFNQGTYTTPAGRKASIDGYSASMVCVVAGPAGSYMRCRCGWIGPFGTVYVGALAIAAAALGDHDSFSVGAAGWLQAGEQFTFEAYTSGGGHVAAFCFGLKVTQCLA